MITAPFAPKTEMGEERQESELQPQAIPKWNREIVKLRRWFDDCYLTTSDVGLLYQACIALQQNLGRSVEIPLPSNTIQDFTETGNMTRARERLEYCKILANILGYHDPPLRFLIAQVGATLRLLSDGPFETQNLIHIDHVSVLKPRHQAKICRIVDSIRKPLLALPGTYEDAPVMNLISNHFRNFHSREPSQVLSLTSTFICRLLGGEAPTIPVVLDEYERQCYLVTYLAARLNCAEEQAAVAYKALHMVLLWQQSLLPGQGHFVMDASTRLLSIEHDDDDDDDADAHDGDIGAPVSETNKTAESEEDFEAKILQKLAELLSLEHITSYDELCTITFDLLCETLEMAHTFDKIDQLAESKESTFTKHMRVFAELFGYKDPPLDFLVHHIALVLAKGEVIPGTALLNNEYATSISTGADFDFVPIDRDLLLEISRSIVKPYIYEESSSSACDWQDDAREFHFYLDDVHMDTPTDVAVEAAVVFFRRLFEDQVAAGQQEREPIDELARLLECQDKPRLFVVRKAMHLMDVWVDGIIPSCLEARM